MPDVRLPRLFLAGPRLGQPVVAQLISRLPFRSRTSHADYRSGCQKEQQASGEDPKSERHGSRGRWAVSMREQQEEIPAWLGEISGGGRGPAAAAL
jgi:hypothetical protein